jgi:hypothetical protein
MPIGQGKHTHYILENFSRFLFLSSQSFSQLLVILSVILVVYFPEVIPFLVIQPVGYPSFQLYVSSVTCPVGAHF